MAPSSSRGAGPAVPHLYGGRHELALALMLGLASAANYPLMHALQHSLGLSQTISRKVVHIATAHLSLLSPMVTAQPWVAGLPWWLFAAVVATSLLFPGTPYLGLIADTIRKQRGDETWTPVAYYTALGVISSLLVGGSRPQQTAALVGLGALAWGDGLSGMVPTPLLHSMVTVLATALWSWAVLAFAGPAQPGLGDRKHAHVRRLMHGWAIGLAASVAEWATGFLATTESWENAAIPLAAGLTHLVLDSRGL